jgi:hypothetical protein
MKTYEHKGRLYFNIDTDSDRSESFQYCVDFISENYNIKVIENVPGGWNVSKFKFELNGISIELLYMDFGGTEMNISAYANDVDKGIANGLAEALTSHLKQKGYTS